MAIRTIILYPDRRLKTPCDEVQKVEDRIRAVVRDLQETMAAGPPRTVGIAAPQIGAMVRVAVVDISMNPKYPGGHGLMILINPVIRASEGTQFFREGCLSIPDYTANIRRAASVTVEAIGLRGELFRIDAEGFEAVVLQHEIDHLDGILFLDRVANVKTDLHRRKE